MKVINLQLTLKEAVEVEMLFGMLAPSLQERVPDRAAVMGRVAAALERDLKKAGATKTDEGWVYPRA